jgi:hypothetical protein
VSETLHAPYQREEHAARIITADLCAPALDLERRYGATFCTAALRDSNSVSTIDVKTRTKRPTDITFGEGAAPTGVKVANTAQPRLRSAFDRLNELIRSLIGSRPTLQVTRAHRFRNQGEHREEVPGSTGALLSGSPSVHSLRVEKR